LFHDTPTLQAVAAALGAVLAGAVLGAGVAELEQALTRMAETAANAANLRIPMRLISSSDGRPANLAGSTLRVSVPYRP
jgi:hypothetical protein